MGRIKIPALLLLAIALPATAQTFDFSIGASAPACLSLGNASYRAVPRSARADHAVRLDPAAAAPACQHKGAAVKTVKIDAAAPDLIAAVTTGPALADYRIYVRSRWMTPETAAALFAAAHAPRRLAGRADRSN